MKILERHKSWIHTDFLTDCTRLPAHRVREVGSRMGAFLRSLGIVFGVHFEEHKGEPGLADRVGVHPVPRHPRTDPGRTPADRRADPGKTANCRRNPLCGTAAFAGGKMADVEDVI